MFIERVIVALEVPSTEYSSIECQTMLAGVLRTICNIITLGKPPTDPVLQKQDLLTLVSLPALMTKLIRGYSVIISAQQVLTEAVHAFATIANFSFNQCKVHFVKTVSSKAQTLFTRSYISTVV